MHRHECFYFCCLAPCKESDAEIEYAKIAYPLIRTSPLALLESLRVHFCDVLQIPWTLPPDLKKEAATVLDSLNGAQVLPLKVRCANLVALINAKFRINAAAVADFLAAAAERKQPLHYHDKQEVQLCFDTCDEAKLRHLLTRKNYDLSLLNFVHSASPNDTLDLLRRRLEEEPKIVESVLRSLFGGYLYGSFPTRAMHEVFNSDCRKHYCVEFFDHLRVFYADSLHRDCALVFLNIDEQIRGKSTDTEFRDGLFEFIKQTYERLGNHCYLAIRIRPFTEEGESGQWRLVSDITLFAEKFREVPLKTGYFHPDRVAKDTKTYISSLDESRVAFDLANEGFFFKDCFVLKPKSASVDKTTLNSYDLLLLFEKNERDERVIPCPACRTLNVGGNSYPVLGVKSWECQNSICPEKSAFDRGNRYSLASLIKQEAIRVEENQISEPNLRKWKLDLTSCAGTEEVVNMLIQHFSLCGDTAVFVNVLPFGQKKYGRNLQYARFDGIPSSSGAYQRFKDSAFFHRYLVERPKCLHPKLHRMETGVDGLNLIQGDCVEVMRQLEALSLDGAVTSPPYYNARSYSQWPNIYCYLHDMFNMATEAFRVLKPGSIYLFNIFDYFDNENNVVFSAMGKKRMILGAYIVDLFRRVGFRIDSNIIWDKGEIEGKRAFNQGNLSPYYQLPLNCWEHVFVFRKPGNSKRSYSFPSIMTIPPVRKFQKGQNLHGHSAPFPDEIPKLLLSQMESGQTILDPYSGSMTTGRTANRLDVDSISIELHPEYCGLSMSFIRQEDAQPELFGGAIDHLNGKAPKHSGQKEKRLNARIEKAVLPSRV